MAPLSESRAEHHSSRSDGTVSPPGSSAPLLGRQAQALIACNQKLQELGIDKTIKLPQICVIGDQSTGKSSLIEAISTIKVPKAKGCCTQCPLAINLSCGKDATSPWTCTVIIEEHYDYEEAYIGKGVTKHNPFGPWQKRDQIKITKVKTTNDKNAVPGMIRAAQLTILNPGTSYQDHLGTDMNRGPPQSTAKFSPNVIRLDVSEGTWPNLSFVDLPGVIANTSREQDRYLVQLIRNLVRKYASAEMSLNMLTLPMTHDVENSQACALIKESKAEPHTLAVFTKADLADDDQRDQFFRKFLGEDSLQFEHGYHFVVMPDHMEQSEARAAERHVFAHGAWSLVDRKHKARFGVDKLTLHLRKLLFQKTGETLPANLKSIENRLGEVNNLLMSLPAPPNAALLPLHLQQSVTQFKNAMKTMLVGDPNSTDLSPRIQWTGAAIKFKDAVVTARPTVFLMSRAEQARLRRAQAQIQKAQTGGEPNSDQVEAGSGEIDHQTGAKSEVSGSIEYDPVHRFRFDEIREINQRHYQACVPGEIELRAIETMNKLSVSHWDKLLNTFMDGNSKLLNMQVNDIVEEVFERYQHLELYDVVQKYVKTCLDDAINEEWTYAEGLCRLEQEQPLTYDSETLKKREIICLKDREGKREEKRLTLMRTEMAASGNIVKAKRKQEESELEADPFQTELVMSVKTRAYYEVASVRFVDNICMGIFGRLLPVCTDKLAERLEKHLGLNDMTKHQQIVEWMSEDPSREAKRRQLIREKNRLTEGLRYIQEVLGSKNIGSREAPKRRQSRHSESDEEYETPLKRRQVDHVDDEDHEMLETPSTTRVVTRIADIELDD